MTIEDALELIEPAPRVSLAKQIEDEFAPYEAKFEEWRDKSKMIRVSSVDDVEAMAMAKTLERFVGKALSSLEKRRKELKAESLEAGRAIDSAAKKFREALEPLREELKTKAEFKERIEKRRQEEKLAFRQKHLLQYGVELDSEMTTMDDEQFEEVVADAKANWERHIEIERVCRERTDLLLSLEVFPLLMPETAKTVGAMSEEEFSILQAELRDKLKEQQEENIRLKDIAELYRHRIEVIQSNKIADYIGDGMSNIGSMDEQSFQAMVTLAINKSMIHEAEISTNRERLSMLTLARFDIPDYVHTNELYLYSEQEFELLIEHLGELKATKTISIRRARMDGLAWDIDDKPLVEMSEQDFENEIFERRRKLKEESDFLQKGSDREKLSAYIAWVKSHPNSPILVSENGIAVTAKINKWLDHLAEKLTESLETL